MFRMISKFLVLVVIRLVILNMVIDWIVVVMLSISSSVLVIMVDLVMFLVNEIIWYLLRVSVCNVISGGFNILGSCWIELVVLVVVVVVLVILCVISGEFLLLVNVLFVIGFLFSRVYLVLLG